MLPGHDKDALVPRLANFGGVSWIGLLWPPHKHHGASKVGISGPKLYCTGLPSGSLALRGSRVASPLLLVMRSEQG